MPRIAPLLLLSSLALCAPPPQPHFSSAVLARALLLEDRAINTCDCATVPSTSRIVGGAEVSPKYKLPYQVMVYPCINGGCYLCGGTLVNKRYVVTASHCLFDGDGTAITPTSGSVNVMLGEHNRCDGVNNEGGKWMTVSAVTTHPNYGNNDNDIAVLKLSEDVTFTAHIKPACLPTTSTKDYSGLASTISGWGGTIQYNAGQTVTQPQQCGLKESVVKVLSSSSDKCSSYLGTSSSTSKLCAWAEGTDTCQGDSGGPLTVAEEGKYVLLGVVSYGHGCATTTPGVYARVQGFLPWLQAIIADGECSSSATAATTAPATTLATSGNVQSDNYPNSYPINQDKTYTINVDAGKKIEMTFTGFEIEFQDSCGWDYLQISDGDGSSLLPKTCGFTKPEKITSKSNKATITFHSDESVIYKGFQITWKAV